MVESVWQARWWQIYKNSLYVLIELRKPFWRPLLLSEPITKQSIAPRLITPGVGKVIGSVFFGCQILKVPFTDYTTSTNKNQLYYE